MSRPGRTYGGPVALRGGSGGAGAGLYAPGRNGAAGRNGDGDQRRPDEPSPDEPSPDGRGPDGRSPDDHGPDDHGPDGRSPDDHGPERHQVTSARVTGWLRPAWVEVDLDAVRANVVQIRKVVAPAAVCAVVKADGYGHGAVPVASAAVEGGATHLGVALAEEGRQLREAGIGVPVLILSEPPGEAMQLVVDDNLTPTIYTAQGLGWLLKAINSRGAGGHPPFAVHVKVDTGMHRVGASPDEAFELARAVAADPQLHLEGLFTHFAVADEPGRPFTAEQLALFQRVVAGLASEGIRPPLLHAANSAGALAHPGSRYQMVRPGIAVYGLAPAASMEREASVRALTPALSLRARVSYVKEVAAGQALSYGLRYRLPGDSVVATVPLGYADGVPRRLSEVGGEVLIGGRRRPLAGTVTMDQVLVDCGPGAGVNAGDEVVFIGRQGDDEINAWDWAERLGTIAYEVTCALSPRLPRIYT
jgi:alanine racemase